MNQDNEKLRNAYIAAFNTGDFEALEQLLHEDAVYRWVTASRAEQGREAVLKLYRMGHEAYGGKSMLTHVEVADDMAVWWEPDGDGFKPAGVQTLRFEEGQIIEIADDHTPSKVKAAAAHSRPLRRASR